MKIISALLFFIILTVPAGLHAQTSESGKIKKAKKKFVSVPVTVSDREGRYISGLKEDDFTVYQDGVKQEIDFFAKYDEPLNIALLLDTSRSTEQVIKKIKDAAEDFIDLLNKEDKCMLATFDSEVKIISPLTSNQIALKYSLENVKIAEQGGTVMYRAVEQVARNSFAKVEGRKVIVLLTDGKDFGSAITKDELLNLLEESDILIYNIFYKTGVGFNQPLTGKKARKIKKPRKVKKGSVVLPTGPIYVPTEEEIALLERSAEMEAVDSLTKMSDTTAGRFYFSDVPGLSKIFKKITDELRQQYRLGYHSREAENAAAHDIAIKVKRADVIVRARGKFRSKQL